MKYFLFLCIIYVLPLFTEQQLVVLKQRNKNGENSHETKQLDPIVHEVEVKKRISGIVNVSDNSEEETGELKVQESTDNAGSEQSKSAEESGVWSEADDGTIFILQVPSKTKLKSPVTFNDDKKLSHWHRWVSEIAAADKGQISGTNPRWYQPHKYPDFGRRFVPQYRYSEKTKNVMVAQDNQNEIIPIQAPLEIVKKVAQQSVLEEAAKPQVDQVIVSKALRTGEYWNAIWVEDVDPKSALRMSNQHVLGTIKAKIKPGTDFYDLVSRMTKISPRLLYIINDKKA